MSALAVPSLGPTQYTGSETDEASHDARITTIPTLNQRQRLRHSSSILAIALSADHIYAGTQTGEILVYDLTTYERRVVIEAHSSSVLGLCLSQDQTTLFSSAGDRTVNSWNTRTWKRTACFYAQSDVGDIFCVAYSSALKTIYLGSQNTTIQWCSQVRDPITTALLNDSTSTHLANDRFFDSTGPGGVRTPKPIDARGTPRHANGGQVIEISNEKVKHFAHNGYVCCMLLVKEGVPEQASQEILISGGGDGLVKLWKLDANKGGAIQLAYSLDDGREEGHSVLAIAMDGTFLYCGRSGGEINVWDMETRQLVRNINAHKDDVLTICVGGGFMFCATASGYIRKFDRQHQMISRLRAHDGRILSSAFAYHKNRPIYVTGANDNSLAVWDLSDCSARSAKASIQTTDEKLVEALQKFVSYRTVSSDLRYKEHCRRGASYLREVFKNFGATTEMLPTDDSCNPIILARFRGNPATAGSRKKILFYGHYDVVDATNESGKWKTDPFVMEGINGYLYGRGTSDNKGPIMAAIFACVELISEQALGSDIIFLIEGEEECGSRGFERAIKASKAKIGDVDWILLANSYWLDDRIPCLTYGLRGVIHATVQVESSHPDLHSGVDGSAQLDESLKDLVILLGTLTGQHGLVRIPGFYDPVPEIGDDERELYVDITTALIQRNPELGDPELLASSLIRRWREASLTIHRFQTSGPDNATIIPRLAKAAISIRLVPNQEADHVAKSLDLFLRTQFARLGSNNRLAVTIDHQAEPWLGDWTNQLFQTLEEAIVEVWGPIDHTRRHSSSGLPLKVTIPPRSNGSYFNVKPSPTTSSVLATGSQISPMPPLTPLSEVTEKLEQVSASAQTAVSQRRKPLYIREGGSIPAIRFLEKEFDAPAAHLPCGQASDSAHLDNERLRLENLQKSKEIFKKVFRDLPQK